MAAVAIHRVKRVPRCDKEQEASPLPQLHLQRASKVRQFTFTLVLDSKCVVSTSLTAYYVCTYVHVSIHTIAE